MAFLEFKNVKISGIAAAVPKEIKEVKDLPFFAEGEAKKVIDLTKIERSRIAKDSVCASDLCYEAAQQLIIDLDWDKNEIDALIFVSLSRDYLTPATSSLLQDRLGLSKECYAIDIPLACSGYIYGLSVISALISSGSIRKALLLVGETTSKLQSSLDKTIWPLHGDAGTATALEFKEGEAGIKFHVATDGSRGDAIINPDGGARSPITESSLIMEKIGPGIIRNRTQSILDGMNVFTFSITEPPRSIRMLCEHFNIDIQTIDYLLLHQANKYMDDKIGKKLNVDSSKIPYCLMQYGNTSSASIPLTMVATMKDILKSAKLSVIMCGFGAGLSWGSVYLDLDKIICSKLIEI
ncbi:MAG: ketoacyl-ACP synthase III [Bacteroidales bacterium]